MLFRPFQVDSLAQVSYLIACGDEAAVIDPRRDIDDFVRFARHEGLRIRYAIGTHVHADFVAGLAELREATGAEIVMGERFDGALPCRRLEAGGELRIGEAALCALATPGHTPESISWLLKPPPGENVPDRLLSGDTLFVGDVGRPDLLAARGFAPADLARDLWHSLHEVLAPLPDTTEVWPAHGAGSACGTAIGCESHTTMGVQRVGNWAFGVSDPDAFAVQLLAAQRRPPAYFARTAAMNAQGPRLLRELPRPRELAAAAVRSAVAAAALVLDVRSCLEHGAGHWPGSLNVALQGGDFEPWCGALIATGRSVVIHASTADAAEEAWLRLLRIGCEEVAGWTSALPEAPASLSQVRPALLRERLAAAPGGWQIIDVRRPGEYATGHVPEALHIELAGDLAADPALATLDRARPTAVICLVGYRSSAACDLLAAAGFTGLHNVVGGMQEWAGLGLPVER